MNEVTKKGLFSSTSARSLGIFLILLSIPFAIAANRETPILAAGMLPCGILFCLASTTFAHRWRYLPSLLVLAGVCAFAAVSLPRLQQSLSDRAAMRKADSAWTKY